MAAPHVSGAVALLASDPIKNYSSPQIEKLLINSATDLGARGYDIYFGEGLVDLSKVNTKNLSPAQFSVENGEYEDEFELTLFSEDDATIYYTTDGTTPSASNGQTYSAPITITKSTLVSAICVNGDLYSKVSFGEYIINHLDIDNAFTVSNTGQLLKYSGILL